MRVWITALLSFFLLENKEKKIKKGGYISKTK